MEIVTDILTEAKLCATEFGWRVVPCHAPVGNGCSCGTENCKKPGKHPRLKGWQTQATTDIEKIMAWWEQWPDANLGIVLGPSSHLIDIEYDDAEGEATAEELLAHVATPKYRSHRSTHHLFSFPDVSPPKAVMRWRGLEFRFGTDGRGAQSIFPPSMHASGKRYEWLNHPSKVGLADAPAWLANAIEEAGAATLTSNGIADGFSFIMQSENETLETHPGEAQGNRHNKLLELVGRYLGTYGPTGELPMLALAWAARCSPPLEPGEVLGVVACLAEKELSRGVIQGGGGVLLTPSVVPAQPRTIKARKYSDIASTDVEWLWHNRIALGKLTLLVGEPGLGKTFAAIDIAAHVTTGKPFPDGSIPINGEVAVLTAEDGAGDTIRPRLDSAGADVTKVLHIDGVGSGDAKGFPSLKDDLAPLEEFFKSRPELRLIVIDPISAFLGDRIDSHSNTQVRAVLGPLCELCERYRVALLGITHLAKSEAKAINRIIGSIAFVAAARACWLVAKDKDNEEQRLFLPVKNNLAICTGLAFAVVDGRCSWHTGEVLISADDVGGDADETPREEAKQWLVAKLDSPRPAKWILKQAKADGISERTLYRAKKELAVISEKAGDTWVWRLPGDDSQGEAGVFRVE